MCLCVSFFWKSIVLQHEMFKVENFFELKKNSMKLSMSCEQTVPRVFESRVKKFRKVKVLGEVHFQQK